MTEHNASLRCCRCADCVAQRHEKRLEKARQRRKLGTVPDGVEHGLAGYTTYGCRCETCSAAGKAYSREWARNNHEYNMERQREYRRQGRK